MVKIESEKLIERKLVELCKLNNGLCIKLLSNFFIGLPDRMCLFPGGKIIFVELKTTGQKPRKSQILVHNQLQKLGFKVFVVDTTEQTIELIDKIIKL